MRLSFSALVFACAAAALPAASPLESAQALVQAKQYPEARAALEKIVAAEPKNAAALHELGLLLRKRADNAAFEQAIADLAHAAELEPQNERYLADYGGAAMEFAGRVRADSLTRALGFATKGRDAMEKALTMNPEDTEARVGLFQFYSQAPWPVGSSAKAGAQLEEIRRRDPTRAVLLELGAKVAAKDYAGAFSVCDRVLANNPSDYLALYSYGRVAAISGQNLERGFACLQKCLALEPPGPTMPTHSHAWNRLGDIQQKLNRPAEARVAYVAALKEDPGNKPAADSLAKLK
ncbi:MAG TPA: tetratricopeptide repeat protein [Opitutaceae bacterium]|nr:tetratricopeptide repeat protein [Opitutaceae bacterium]